MFSPDKAFKGVLSTQRDTDQSLGDPVQRPVTRPPGGVHRPKNS